MTDDSSSEPGPDPEKIEDDAPSRGATVARFFVLPLLVVGTALVIFLVFNLMTFERRSPADELAEVRGGTANRRWQAAFELSRTIGRMPPGPDRDTLAAETLRVFEGLSGKRPDDVKVRRYLVLVLGKLQDRAALPALLSAAKDDDPETRLYAIWALGMLRNPAAFETVLESSQSADPGVRKMAAYVLGKLGDARAVPRLRVLLGDSTADVRWNSAIGLAELHDAAGAEALRSMIDRAALARQAALSADQTELAMVSALQALAILRDRASLPAVERLAREDPNLRVREAARNAAAAIRGISIPSPAKAKAKVTGLLETRATLLVV